MRSGGLIVALAIAAALSLGALAVPAASDDAADKLAAPESFAGIADPAVRSAAMFVELGKVLTHPRCLDSRSLTGGGGHGAGRVTVKCREQPAGGNWPDIRQGVKNHQRLARA